MTRVASMPLQQTLADSIQRAHVKLGQTQKQMSTGKKAQDYAGLGADAIRTVTARALLVKTDSYMAVSRQLGTKLTIYDAHVSQLERSGNDLREALASGLGTQVTVGLQMTMEATFAEFSNTLNASDGSDLLFAGSRTDGPVFTPSSIAETLTITDADAFRSDGVRMSSRLGEGVSVEYGVDARELGTEILQAFRKLAAEAPFGDAPSDTQKTAMKEALDLLDAGLAKVRTANGENGRLQARVETLAERAEGRAIMLSDVISRTEDVDLATVATSLAQQKTMLEASYSVFAQLSGLSLVNFLR